MARLFISHSSENNAEAAALNLWLKEQGWDDVFLDVTPDRGIAAGERWERALNEAASRCEAVLFMVSRPWIASRWCRKEYDLARRLNKRLFGALIETIPVAELPSEITETFQMVDLASGKDHRMIRVEMPRTHEEVHVTFSQEGLSRLKQGLAKAGLDPRFFRWPPENDPDRAPYRGLAALEAEDAGIFFGRDAPIVEALDELRGLAEAAPPRLFVILGASGAGKSSFLRAGLLPRLARDDRTFLALPVIRPEGGAVGGETGLLPALERGLRAHGIAQSRAALRAAIASGAGALRPILAELAARAQVAASGQDAAAKPPVLTLAIDQAEELFQPGNEAEELLGLVRELVAADDPAVIVLFTIRSDSYDLLETAKPLEGLRQRPLALLPMPRGAYQTVIEGPAARLAGGKRHLAIDPRLTQRLLEEIERGGGSDALPLLAFTLGQLYLDFGGGGTLRLEDYESFGGVRGAIEAAVRRALAAADRDPRIPRDPDARLALLRRGLIPWLAGVDPETSSPRRRLARLSDIPEEAAPLIQLLVEQRLLSVDRITVRDGERERSEVTIEPAHEALLRQWGLLRGWLEEDFAALAVLDGVKRGARDWEANGRGADWLNHTGTRLAEAEEVAGRPDLAADLGPAARDYLRECRARDDAEERERQARLESERQLQESRLKLAEADRIAAEEKARAAQERTAAARRLTRLTAAAALAITLLVATAGGLFALAQMRGRQAAQEEAANLWVSRSQFELAGGDPVGAVRSAAKAVGVVNREQTRSALLAALLEIPHLVGTAAVPGAPAQALAWLDEATIGFASQTAALRTVAAAPGAEGRPAAWASPSIPDLGAGYVFVRALRLVAPDRLLAAMSDGAVLALSPGHREPVELRKPGEATVVDAAAIGRTGAVVVTAANGEGVSVMTCGTGSPPCSSRKITESNALSVALDPGETRVALGDEGGAVFLFGIDGAAIGSSLSLGAAVTSLGWSGDGALLAAGTAAGEVAVIDVGAGAVAFKAQVSGKPVGALGFTPNGLDLAAACGEAACLLRLRRGPDNGLDQGRSVRLPGHRGSITGLAWSPGGDRLATAFADGLIRVWRADPTGVPGAALQPESHAAVMRIAPSPERNALAAGLADGSAQVWSLREAASGRTLPAGGQAEVRSVALARDGRVAAVLDDGALAIWPPAGGEPRLKRWDARANPGLAWVAGGALAVALSDGRIALHEPESGRDDFLPGIGPGADPWGLVASPDGATLYASYVKGEIRRWEVASKRSTPVRPEGTTEADRGGPESLSLSPDGRRLAATAEDAAIRLLDAGGGGAVALRTDSPQTRTVAFSPDGRRLAALGADGGIVVWSLGSDAAARQVSLRPPGGDGAGQRAGGMANWLAWSGAARLALAGPDSAIRMFELDDAAWLRRAENLDLKISDPP